MDAAPLPPLHSPCKNENEKEKRRTHTHPHTQKQTHTHTDTHTRAHAHTHTHPRARVRTHTKHAHAYAHAHTRAHTRTHSHTHTRACASLRRLTTTLPPEVGTSRGHATIGANSAGQRHGLREQFMSKRLTQAQASSSPGMLRAPAAQGLTEESLWPSTRPGIRPSPVA